MKATHLLYGVLSLALLSCNLGNRSKKNESPPATDGQKAAETQKTKAHKEKEPRRVRPMVVGPRGWYVTDPSILGRQVDQWMARGRADACAHPAAVVVPHAGYRYSGPVAGRVFGALRASSVKPLRIVILAVAHHYPLRGVSVGDYTHYETPFGLLKVDRKAVKFLLKAGEPFSYVPQAHAREHSLEMELPFIKRAWPDVKIVPLLVGTMDRDDLERAGVTLAQIMNERTLLVASSDFTHRGPRYEYDPFRGAHGKVLFDSLRQLDMGAWKAIEELSAKKLLEYKARTSITMCGIWPVSLMLETLSNARGQVKMRLLEYRTSYDVTHDDSNTVSYLGIMGCREGDELWGLDMFEQKTLHTIAERVLDRVTRAGWDPRNFDPGDFVHGLDLDPMLTQPKAAFVTLKKRGRLRGCIGYLRPHGPLWEAVARNAQSAALFDRRFRPVTHEELKDIEVEISVLSLPRKVQSYKEIKIGKHGIILYYQGHRATFLPQVAPEQGWDLETTLRHLAVKAGLTPDVYPAARYEVYTAQVF